MVNLEKILAIDPTLEAADRELETRAQSEQPRPYLGMSNIGESCQRRSWYRFRFVSSEKYSAEVLKKFEDGHRTEALVIERLKMVKGVELIDLIDGKQISFRDCDGHFSGHADGDITGILQAQKTPHILEVKCTADKKFNELKKLVASLGEKMALRQWNTTYFAQAQLYMHYRGYTRHYLVAATPGGRDWMGVRTEYDAAFSMQMVDRAKRIIKAQEPPDRVSNTPDFFECRYCHFSEICHQDAMPDRSCRTCIHSSPIENGAWHCERWGKRLTLEDQLRGCMAHLYIPALVPGEVTEADQEKCKITYKMKDGDIWIDAEVS